jgi:hypothetical protein
MQTGAKGQQAPAKKQTAFSRPLSRSGERLTSQFEGILRARIPPSRPYVAGILIGMVAERAQALK